MISSFLFPVTIFLLSILFPNSLCIVDERYTNCPSSFDCGKFTNISYPFWRNGQPDYCGHPGFELDCQGDNVTMEIKNKEFLVIDIDREAQILKVARTDLMQSLCPDQYFNTSINYTLFHYTSNDEVATSLLYNCPHMDDPGPYRGFVCSINNSPRNCYFVMSTASANELAGSCEVSVVVPILALAVQGLFDLGIQAVLNEGFEVAWMVDEAECRDCNRSGGRCGFDLTWHEFRCFCPNGSYARTCHDPPVPALAPADPLAPATVPSTYASSSSDPLINFSFLGGSYMRYNPFKKRLASYLELV